MAATGGKNSTDVAIEGSGTVVTAPKGTALPTDTTTAFTASYYDHGYTTPEGVTFTPSLETYQAQAWQSLTAVRSKVLSRNFLAKFTLIQAKGKNLSLAFGGGTWAGATPPYTFTPPTAGATDDRVMVVETVDGSDIRRWCFPWVTLEDVGDIPNTGQNESRLDVTMRIIGDDWSILSNDARDIAA